MGSVCTSPRAINVTLFGCFTGEAAQLPFQPVSTFLSAGLGIFCAGAATRSPVEPSGRRALRVGVLTKHVEFHNRRLSIHSRVRAEPRCARSPRVLVCVKAFRGPSTFIMTLVAFPQGGGVKRTMLPMPGPRAMAALVSCYRVAQVDVRAPFDRVRGLDALPRWDLPARHPRLALNTA